MFQPTVLVVDDDAQTRALLEERLTEEGYRAIGAPNGQEALERFAEGVDAVLLDYELPDTNGFALVPKMARLDPSARIIMITAHAAVPHAVEGMKLGLFDYVPKPLNLEVVTRALRNATTGRLPFSTSGHDLDAVLGESEAMQELRALLHKVAESRSATILLTGETGTGKGLVARALHQASVRARGPFMNVACTALPTGLLESELFGHERGAFTDAKRSKQGLFELADGGTLFLDEIGDMDLGLQAKLLQVLEDRTFRRVGGTRDLRADIRLIAATHVDLLTATREGRFRSDLYYRLAVVVVHLPPLRERDDDVLLLARHFLRDICRQEGKEPLELDAEAIVRLREHSWPGNVRELRNVIERAVLLGDGQRLDLGSFEGSENVHESANGDGSFRLPSSGVNMRTLERDMVEQALSRTGGNVTRAAALLGLNRDQMRYRLDKFGIRRSDFET